MKRLILIALILMPTSVWAEYKSISGSDDIQDNTISEDGPTDNYGTYGYVYIYGDQGTGDRWNGLIYVHNIADSLGAGATITDCGCSLYVSTSSATTIYAYRALKTWIYDQSTWNIWKTDYEWGTSGAENASDGDDNSGDGSGYDRWSTAAGSFAPSSGWQELDLSTTLCQNWYDGTWNSNGIVLRNSTSVSTAAVHSVDGTNKPFFYFTYTTAGGKKPWKVLK